MVLGRLSKAFGKIGTRTPVHKTKEFEEIEDKIVWRDDDENRGSMFFRPHIPDDGVPGAGKGGGIAELTARKFRSLTGEVEVDGGGGGRGSPGGESSGKGEDAAAKKDKPVGGGNGGGNGGGGGGRRQQRQRRHGRKRNGGAGGRGKKGGKGRSPPPPPSECAVLDSNAAVLYGKYVGNGLEDRIHPSIRGLLCDKAVEKVVTPAVMREVHGLRRGGVLNDKELGRIKALLVEGVTFGADRVADVIEAGQKKAVGEDGSETAMRWLAAKRKHYEKATGSDYGPPHEMTPVQRYEALGKLCEMAASDRLVMAEAAIVSRHRLKTTLISADADVSLFGDVLRTAADGNIDVVSVPPASRDGYGW